MTGRQLRGALRRLHLSQSGAARLLGVDGRSVRRWLAGDAPVPRPVELVFHCWTHHDGPPAAPAPQRRKQR